MSEPPRHNSQTNPRLEELADAFGMPVSAFLEKHPQSFVREACDLIRLYAAITDDQGRLRLMDVAVREAARCRLSNISEV